MSDAVGGGGERDRRVVEQLANMLQKMEDFRCKTRGEAVTYAGDVVRTLRAKATDGDDFRDQLIGLLANIRNLNGEIAAQSITAAQLATMDITEMLSREQRAAQRAFARKRAREQVNFDKTSMLCTKCGLVRRDRLNLNEVALDSEENGTQFDYNFDNTCTCSHSSESSSESDDDGSSSRNSGVHKDEGGKDERDDGKGHVNGTADEARGAAKGRMPDHQHNHRPHRRHEDGSREYAMSHTASQAAKSARCTSRSPERYTRHEGFYTLRTSGTESLPPLYKDAADLLAQVHVELSGASRSVDARAELQSTLRRAIAKEGRAARAWYALSPTMATPPSSKDTEELPALPFVPMATAPVWTLGIAADLAEHVGRSSTTTSRPDSHSASPSMGPPSLQSSSAATHQAGKAAVPCTSCDSTTVSHGQARLVRNAAASHRRQAVPSPQSAEARRDASPRGFVTHSPSIALPLSSPSSSTALRPAPPAPALPTRRDVYMSTADGEKEAAVRDYLRRMNILSQDTACAARGGPDTVYADALYSGTALCQLVSAIIVRQADSATRRGAVSDAQTLQGVLPRRQTPRSLQEVDACYAAAVTAAAARLALPPPLAQSAELNAKAVFVTHRLTALLDLYVYLIAHYLPPPDELPHSRTLSWQTPADLFVSPSHAVDKAIDAALCWRMERDVCGFLTDAAVLPDPDTYDLPPDDYLVPEPCRAPFVSTLHGGWVPRRTVPAGLYVPSVFPYLCNGTVLCRLARRLTPRATWSPTAAYLHDRDACALVRRNVPHCHENPRTERTCLANLTAALECFAVLGNAVTSTSHTVAAELYHGHRWRIVQLLYEVHSAGALDTTAASPSRVTPARERVVAEAVPAVSAPASAARENAVSGRAAPAVPQAALQRATTASPVAANRLAALELPTTTVGEAAQLCDWLRCVLGPHFAYRAEDDSFAVQGGALELRAPCLIFADGVVLAHLLRVLERRRCDRLACVLPTSKLAAKRFNVRQCLRFLHDEKGIVLAEPLLEEALLCGALDGVYHVLRVLRHNYRFVHGSH